MDVSKPSAASVASIEAIKERRAKAAEDILVRQQFKMPETMAMPQWALRLDALLAVPAEDRDFAWLRFMTTHTSSTTRSGDAGVEASAWYRTLTAERSV